MKRIVLSAIALVAAWGGAIAQPQMNREEAEKQAEALLSKLTLDEKIAMTRGYNKFFLPGAPEKGIPYVYTADASSGVRINNSLPDPNMIEHPAKTTQFPATIALASTFNPELAYEYGKAVGEEARMAGVGILLGPGMNIYRSSQCGRNFEYLGEDPYLAARFVEQYVKGMQSTGTMACLKHFVCNNTEFYRRRSNSIVDERAIMEIYTPAFKAGIDAGAGSVMTAYNLVNGEWAGQSKYVITDLLRGRLGFDGLVMSDWRSVYDWKKIVLSGQNVEMPGDEFFYPTESVHDLIAKGELTEKNVDDMIRPMIAACVRFGLYDNINNGERYKKELAANMPAHLDVAYRTAAEGTVLLTNNGILPLSTDHKILLTGRWAKKNPQGGGSSKVKGYDIVTFAYALKESFGSSLEVVEKPTAEQLEAADVVICATGTYDTEGSERPFAMEKKDEALVRLAVAHNPRTIVVVNSGSGIDMSAWADKAAAILYGWYPGQNGYKAIRDIIIGKINPSGKLPMTLERSFADSPAKNTVPKGANINQAKGNPNEKFFYPFKYDVHYDESVLVGYRWYETKGIAPLFPFGYGLSYTKFTLTEPKILSRGKVKTIAEDKPLKIAIAVTNTGDREGSEVVQLYVSEKNPTVLRPKKELKAFRRVTVEPNKKQVVVFELDRSALGFWDETTHDWKVNAGEYVISLGTSSADIAAELSVTAL